MRNSELSKRTFRREKLRRRAEKNVRSKETNSLRFEFEKLEARQVLAAIFPVYINGVFSLGDPAAPVPYALADTLNLETNPTASKTIYLDFDGHHSVNNAWNHDVTFDPFDLDGNPTAYSDAELTEIQKTFQHVAEDFAGFDVNVTTKEPALAKIISNGPTDTEYGIRCLMTQQNAGFNGGWGGIAILNSFGSTDDTPCFAVNKGVNVGSITASHEIGHTFGLLHDGNSTLSYHPGVGSGPTSWGPIMGAPFFDTPGGANSVQWSKGEYTDANNTEDDYLLILDDGVNYKVDDFGDNFASAATLKLTSATDVFDWGFVTTPNDTDYLKFETGDGPINLRINPFGEHPNLDVFAQIFDETGSLVASSNPPGELFAEFNNLQLAQGTYFLRIDGVGNATNENIDYGSTGFFSVSGKIVEPILGPKTIGETGIASVSSQWTTITLSKKYNSPIVVAGPASRVGFDPLTVRIRNVTRTSFDIRLDEWDYRDGIHGNESVSFMVIEAGRHILSDGTVIEAGGAVAGHRWTPVPFIDDPQFNNPPVVFAQITTTRELDAATTRISNISNNGFRVRVQEEQASDYVHRNESIHWIAISKGSGTQGSIDFEVNATPNEVTHLGYSVNFTQGFTSAPAFFANMQTYNGGDPATVRSVRTNAVRSRIFLEEERSFDAEIQHNPEVVGYMAIEPGQIVIPPVPPSSIPKAPYIGYHNPDDPARLLAALKQMEAYDKKQVPLPCGCGNCMGNYSASGGDGMSGMAAFISANVGSTQKTNNSLSVPGQSTSMGQNLGVSGLAGAVSTSKKTTPTTVKTTTSQPTQAQAADTLSIKVTAKI